MWSEKRYRDHTIPPLALLLLPLIFGYLWKKFVFGSLNAWLDLPIKSQLSWLVWSTFQYIKVQEPWMQPVGFVLVRTRQKMVEPTYIFPIDGKLIQKLHSHEKYVHNSSTSNLLNHNMLLTEYWHGQILILDFCQFGKKPLSKNGATTISVPKGTENSEDYSHIPLNIAVTFIIFSHFC